MNVIYVYGQSLHIMVGAGTLRNTPMNERRYIAHIGVDNTIDLEFKDSDRKPVNILSKTVIWQMTDPVTGDILIRKNAPVSEGAIGRAKLELHDHDTVGIPAGIYHVGISLLSSDGTSAAGYMDQNYDARAEIELKTGAYEAFRVTNSTSVFESGISSSLPAAGRVSDVNMLNTLAVYMTNFTGTIYAETTLKIDFPGDTWHLVGGEGWHYANYTGIGMFNIESRAMHIRIRSVPEITNVGSIDKFSCRA